MNDWNSMEEQLRSWKLRQPSARVEQALWPKQPADAPRKRSVARAVRHWQGGWAAGLASCAILAVTAVNLMRLDGMSPGSALIAASAISNASYAASFAAVQHNCLTAPIFGWTNESELHSLTPSLDLLNTNLLR